MGHARLSVYFGKRYVSSSIVETFAGARPVGRSLLTHRTARSPAASQATRPAGPARATPRARALGERAPVPVPARATTPKPRKNPAQNPPKTSSQRIKRQSMHAHTPPSSALFAGPVKELASSSFITRHHAKRVVRVLHMTTPWVNVIFIQVECHTHFDTSTGVVRGSCARNCT